MGRMKEGDDCVNNEALGDREITDALAEHIAVLDRNGRIVTVNAAWRKRMAGRSRGKIGVGANYFEACRNHSAMGLPNTEAILSSLQSVANGRIERFSAEYFCAPSDPQKGHR